VTAPKHSADRLDLAQIMADAARDREQILAQLGDAEPVKPAVSTRWTVVRQFHSGGEVVESLVCRHRFERVAHWCSYRRTRSHTGETGAHYTVRRTDA
jgi:hypothetical protein